jgi:hypothetical protein
MHDGGRSRALSVSFVANYRRELKVDEGRHGDLGSSPPLGSIRYRTIPIVWQRWLVRPTQRRLDFGPKPFGLLDSFSIFTFFQETSWVAWGYPQ